MTHFGILCPGTTSHLNLMCNLGRELIQRVAIPITNDQPSVAARVARVGAGLVVPVKKSR
jgi:hypothetical protein